MGEMGVILEGAKDLHVHMCVSEEGQSTWVYAGISYCCQPQLAVSRQGYLKPCLFLHLPLLGPLRITAGCEGQESKP